jgi:hypothetical protein
MKFSNFEIIEVIGNNSSDKVVIATVDVTTVTGKWWWKKSHTKNREIRKMFNSPYSWFFVDTGEYLFPSAMESLNALERSYNARKAYKPLEVPILIDHDCSVKNIGTIRPRQDGLFVEFLPDVKITRYNLFEIFGNAGIEILRHSCSADGNTMYIHSALILEFSLSKTKI